MCKRINVHLLGLFAVMLLGWGALAPQTNAALITDEDVDEQERVVMVEVVELLQENVKLLQMLYIQKLEARVEYLQSLADARS